MNSYIVHILKNHVLPAWHGLRTGLTWTVNKHGRIQRKSPETKSTLKVLFQKKNAHGHSIQEDKNETEPVWLSPIFAFFQAPPCKDIRVNYTYNHKYIKPVYSK